MRSTAPQSFWLRDVLGTYDQAVADGEHYDSYTIMHECGHLLHRVEGPPTNIEITTVPDYYIRRTFMMTLVEDRAASGGE